MGGYDSGFLHRWAQAIEDMRKPAFWLTYVAAFTVTFISFWLGFLCHGKGFIWFIDGLEEQYMFFLQEGQWLRDLLNNVFVTGTFELPMWSQQIGYGADFIYSTCNTLGNPINLLSVFAVPESADLILEATVPLTLFLAGLAFLWYCSYKQFDSSASLVGCLVYLFGGYSFIAYTQIYLLYVLVLAPLVARGVDRIFDGMSPLGFIVSMALAFLAGVSAGYMICLVLFVYCFTKYFFLPEKKSILGFLKWFGKIAGCIVLGALIAGVLFYPLAANILSQGRLGLERVQDLFYPLSFYISATQGFLAATDIGEDCMTGFAPLALVCISVLFAIKTNRASSERMAKILFAAYTIMLLLPIVGRISNGFAYANNRWVFGYAFCVAAIVAYMLPKIRLAKDAEKRRALGIMGAYALVCLVGAVLNGGTYSASIGFAVLVLTVCVWLAFARKDGLFKLGMLVSVALSCLLVSFSMGTALAGQKLDVGQAYDATVTANPASLVANLDSSDASTRYDTGIGVTAWRNGNWALGLSGSTFYNSYYNSFVDEYHTSLGLTSSAMNFSYCTFNSRTAMEALGGVQYFVARADNPTFIPPTFSDVVASGEVAGADYEVYSTEDVVPLAYIEDDTLSRDDYDKLGLVDRQEALLQAVVLEGDGVDGAEIESHSSTLPYSISFEPPDDSTLDITSEVSDGDDSKVYIDGSEHGTIETAVPEKVRLQEKEEGVTISDGSIFISQPDTVLYFDVDIPADVEAYFCINNLNYESVSERYLFSEEEWADLSLVRRLKIGLRSFFAEEARQTLLYVYSDGVYQEIWQMNGRHHLYGGKHTWAVNLGYSDHERKAVAVKFGEPGIYTFDSIDLRAENVSAVIDDIGILAGNSAQDISYEGNKLTCSVENAKAGEYLAIRMPYNAGWSATVNGKPAEIVRSNVGFMAIRLDGGPADVVLTFETPYLRTGLVASAVGLVLTAVLLSARRYRRRRG